MSETYEFFASCPKGVEGLLAEELATLGGEAIRQTVAGCYFTSDLKAAYRICLWSRLANRVLLQLRQIDAESRDFLYDRVKAIPWEDTSSQIPRWPSPLTALAVRSITATGALVVKDAICDRLRDKPVFVPTSTRTAPISVSMCA